MPTHRLASSMRGAQVPLASHASRSSRGTLKVLNHGSEHFGADLKGASPRHSVSTSATTSGTSAHLQKAGGPEQVVRVPDFSDMPSTSASSHVQQELSDHDQVQFVRFFRQASPYIEGHRGKVFVIGVPGEVISNEAMCDKILEDIAMLQLLGVKIVMIVGAYHQIEELMRLRNRSSVFVDGYRVTDRAAMRASMEAAGQVRIAVEARLSKGPSIAMIRRHEKTGGQVHFAPALRVVGGNFVTAKRRGIIGGVDFQYTGEVRFVMVEAIQHHLDEGNIVILNNLGYSATGEVLNCNSYEVACMTAKALHADKLIFFTLDDVRSMNLPRWLKLSDAEKLIGRFARAHRMQKVADALADNGPSIAFTQEPTVQNKPGLAAVAGSSPAPSPSPAPPAPEADPSASLRTVSSSEARRPPVGASYDSAGPPPAPEEVSVTVDLDSWVVLGCPWELSASVSACRAGIKRAHLVDASVDGGLLLELFTRDGVGTMISRDFYEGCRPADHKDLEAVMALLEPLQRAGVLAPRSPEVLRQELECYYVVEREAKVLACGALVPLGEGLAEVAAFCVAPEFRGGGRGDSLLEYIENEARDRGLHTLILLTTRTADWFVQRGFSLEGAAHSSELLPAHRREKINPARNSQLYIKRLEDEGRA